MQYLRIAQGCHVKRLKGIQALAAQLADLVRLRHGGKHRQTGAAAHVGRQTDLHIGGACAGQIEQTATQESIGGRAESDSSAGFRQSCAVAVINVNTVRQYAALAEQAKVVIHVEVAGALREQFLDPGDLGVVLGPVGLHQNVGVLGDQLACVGQLLRR